MRRKILSFDGFTKRSRSEKSFFNVTSDGKLTFARDVTMPETQ